MNKIIWATIVTVHWVLILLNVAAIPVLISLPYYLMLHEQSMAYSAFMGVALATPLIIFITRLGYHWNRCPITDLENVYRQRLGWPKIHGFLNHYLDKGRETMLKALVAIFNKLT